MLSHNSKQRFACAVLCLFAAGCYGPGLHSPYGGRYPQNGYFSGTPYGQPQFLNQPGFNQQIPGSYTVPGGVVLPPSGSVPYTPGGGTEFPAGSGSSTITPSGDWQPFNELPGDGFGSGGLGSGTTDAGYGTDNGSGGLVPRPPNGGGDIMFEADASEPFGRVDSSQLEATASAYRQPRRVVSSAPSPTQQYGYAQADYSWLRGIISPDNDDPQAFNITYDLAGIDEYNGNFVLAPDQRLNQFRPGDIVEVRGRIDQSTTNDLGKPKYRISSVRRISR